MKKLMLMLFAALFSVTAAFSAFAIDVYVDHTKVAFDTEPMLINDRTMVPIRSVAQALNCKVDWDEEDRSVSVEYLTPEKYMMVYLPIDATAARVITLSINEEGEFALSGLDSVPLDSPATIINDRTYLPLRFISETFDCEVTWVQETQTVEIASNEMAYGAVYKTKDGQTQRVLTNGFSNVYTGFADNRIYFIDTFETQLTSCDLTGANEVTYSEHIARKFDIYNDKLYYIDSYNLMMQDINGENRVSIGFPAYDFWVDQNGIYYRSTQDVNGTAWGHIDLDGQNDTKLAYNGEDLVYVSKDKVFYLKNYIKNGFSIGSALMSQNFDGSGDQTVLEDAAKVYFSDTAIYSVFGGVTTKTDLDGKNPVKLADEVLTLADQNSAFTVLTGEKTTYLVLADGTVKTIDGAYTDVACDAAGFYGTLDGSLYYLNTAEPAPEKIAEGSFMGMTAVEGWHYYYSK